VRRGAGQRFAAYCKGETTRWGGDLVTPFQANVPVVLDGVGVIPGHYVYTDSAGVVVIPADDIAAVLEEAGRIERQDAGYLDQIRAADLRGGVDESESS